MFRQVLLATVIAVGLFVFVLVAGNAIREVLGLLASGRLTWADFGYFLAILIPGVVPYALPLGLLFATLLVLGRLSAQSEILAMKAAGLSLWRIAAPILLIAILGTGLALIIGFYYAPLADSTYKKKLTNIVRNDPLRFIQQRTFIKDFPGFVIYVDSRSGNELRDFYIWELTEDGKVHIFVQGARGNINYSEEDDAIILTIIEGTGEQRKADDAENLQDTIPVVSYENASVSLSLDRILGSEEQNQKLSLMTLDELLDKRRLAIQAPSSDESLTEQMNVQVAIQKKVAFSFSVLSLCIFAIPLGIKASRSETYANLGIALALALVYFMLTIMISWTEKTPSVRPDLLLWIPNFIFQAFGFYMLYRANKH
ncbi:LptF/LptG family permease [Rubellicoccus peritrichatus]|uniref:LptF/LptG family permease n=1 Tax=Rubellicoccus peritrichatus TaxID=3080537 RepID=A0AAQ3LDL0_9BACT|nr:LptF/LptG family permease [Puniceicoccus sp. CR14]WOO43745.1 LptF/LptG family permease [Puniceicoccus sp. CR14]